MVLPDDEAGVSAVLVQGDRRWREGGKKRGMKSSKRFLVFRRASRNWNKGEKIFN